MKNDRIIFLDWMRVATCFMVMAIHAAEPFYLGGALTTISAFMVFRKLNYGGWLYHKVVRRIPFIGKLICG